MLRVTLAQLRARSVPVSTPRGRMHTSWLHPRPTITITNSALPCAAQGRRKARARQACDVQRKRPGNGIMDRPIQVHGQGHARTLAVLCTDVSGPLRRIRAQHRTRCRPTAESTSSIRGAHGPRMCLESTLTIRPALQNSLVECSPLRIYSAPSTSKLLIAKARPSVALVVAVVERMTEAS
jgi:hypothetical protein